METYFTENFNMCFYNDNEETCQYYTNDNYDFNTYLTNDAVPTVCFAAPHHMTVGTMMRGCNAASIPVKNEYDSMNGQLRHSKNKRVRTAFNNVQILALEQQFRCSPYITRASRLELAVRIQLPELQIKIWFQNRRMKAKKESERVRRDSSHSPSSISDTNTPSSPEIENYLENTNTALDDFYSSFPYEEPKPEFDYNFDEYLIDYYSSIMKEEKNENQFEESSEEKHEDFTLYGDAEVTPDNSTSEDDFFKICGEELVDWILENSSGHFFG